MATYGAAVSEHPDPAQAIGEVLGVVLEAVGAAPDVALLFVGGAHIGAIDDISDAVHRLLEPGVLIGSTTGSVIGGAEEVEDGPAISLWAGCTGPAEAVRLEAIRSADRVAVVGMPDEATVGKRTLLLLADPFSFPTEAFTIASNTQYPRLTVVGGVASAGGPGVDRLLLNGSVHPGGAVGVLLPEGLGEVALVSQGCRPVGDPFIVTGAEGNAISGLASRPAMQRLTETIDNASDSDRALLTRGLHIGIVVEEGADHYASGDFLIRGVLGADHKTGALRVGTRTRVGTTVQFHVRDAMAASDDLGEMLGSIDADAALVFSCNGRGTQLFGTAHHDAAAVSEAVRRGPVAGMSCAGEIGPVGGENHVHGFSASVLLLYG